MLIKNEVHFLLVGSYAVGIHGHVRATNDIDIWIESTQDNAERTEIALREFGYDLPQLSAEMLIRPSKITRMGRPPMRIEILNSISGVTFDEASISRIIVDVDELRIPVIGLEQLIKNKRAAGRTKDIADAEELERGS